jgi:hypothetical protein
LRLGAAEQVAASVVEGKVALEKLRGSQTAMEVEGELTQEASRIVTKLWCHEFSRNNMLKNFNN